MTYTVKKYKSFQEYLEDEELSPDKRYRLLSTGEAIEVGGEDEINLIIEYALIQALQKIKGISFLRYIRKGDRDLQVHPVGDKWVNRRPDVMVIKPEHLEIGGRAIFFDMPAPAFAAEVVSPGGESSENYLRDYVWKRQQYEWWQIPEYWIIDPHREKVTVLMLVNGTYQETVFVGESVIQSAVFPALELTVDALISGQIDD
ncbi:MAG: Uma2 family endonuclease [Cyanobacteria bacterium J06634_6]